MFDQLVSFIAPHRCYSCDANGVILCQSCIYNIVSDAQNRCFGCRLPANAGICQACAPRLPFSAAYSIGERKDELERLLNDFKFKRAYRVYASLAHLLDQSLPFLPDTTVVVPIPTIAKHIRIRGYDHTHLIARAFASQRGLAVAKVLRRKTNSVQLGANARQRREQADQAYECRLALSGDMPYLLIDDIATTGATLVAAATCLQQAGAQTIIAAVVARQPLEAKKAIS